MKQPLPKSGWRELLAWRFGRRHAFRMADEAMIPTLPPDAVIFFDPAAYDKQSPQVGDLVLTRHPFQAEVQMIRRVGEIRADGRYVLHSDNPLWNDNRGFGNMPHGHILAKVTSRLK